jgi:hypothetical protein
VAVSAALGSMPGTAENLSTGQDRQGGIPGSLAWRRVSTARREARTSSGISFQTLAIASISSLAAAIVVHRLWSSGAIIGAAITPVIVSIVGEALRRPVDRLSAVREGGRKLPAGREHDVEPVSRQRGDDPFGLWEEARPQRSRGRTWLALGIVTGVIGFAIAAFVLTGSELALGGSVSGGRKTTIFGGGHTTTTVQTVTQTTTTPTVTQTVPSTTPQAQTVPTVTQTVPSTTPQQGAAPGTATPTTQQAPVDPAATTQTPAP